jgi:hypothetical protein
MGLRTIKLRILMALKIVERLLAIFALVEGLAGGRSKLAEYFRMGGMTLRAFNYGIGIIPGAYDRRGDAIFF